MVVYYVIALALYMQASYREVLRCLLEGIQWLLGPGAEVKVAGKSGISQARSRSGWEAVQRLHDEVVRPIAVAATRGAWYGGWRLVSLDGSTLDVADESDNEKAFGRPGASRGASAYPQIRFASLVENGTHVLFGSAMGDCRTGEITLAQKVLLSLRPGMLCLADRNSSGPGGVIDYRLEGVAGAEPIYHLVTTILEPRQAPAQELAALYRERVGDRDRLDELKTQLRGSQIVLRSKKPRAWSGRKSTA